MLMICEIICGNNNTKRKMYNLKLIKVSYLIYIDYENIYVYKLISNLSIHTNQIESLLIKYNKVIINFFTSIVNFISLK